MSRWLMLGVIGVTWLWGYQPKADVVPHPQKLKVPAKAVKTQKLPEIPIKHGPLSLATENHRNPVKNAGNPEFQWLYTPGDTLYYDNPATAGSNGIGLTNGGTFEAAVLFTPDELGPYGGYAITQVIFFHNENGTHSGRVIIYGPGNPPTDTITTEPYTATGQGWINIPLTTPVLIDPTQDIWVSIEITHNQGEYPMGVDGGPAVAGKGDWVGINGQWDELRNYNLDYNWDIRAIVEPAQLPDHDIAVQSIIAPSGELPANVPVTPQAVFVNRGCNSETFDAFFEIYKDGNLLYRDSVLGTVLDSGQNITLSFTDWTPVEGGVYTAIAFHNLPDDQPINDTLIKNFTVRVTGNDYLIIDLDPNQSSAPLVDQALIALGFAGKYTTDASYLVFDSLISYSTVWVFCGIFSSNTQITPDQGAQIEQYLQNGGKLYIEGGDLWGYDPGHGGWENIFDWTGVASAEDGSSDLATIQGVSNALIPEVDGHTWSYTGENNWIDRLTPNPNPPMGGTAVGYLQNPDVGYFCGVAYDAGSFKTVGNSFELGGVAQDMDSLVAWIMNFLYAPPPEHDIAATAIVEPGISMFIGDSALPIAVFRNLGNSDETFDAFFEIYDSQMNQVYSASVSGISIAAGAVDTVNFGEWWTPSDTGLYYATTYSVLPGDMRPSNDTLTIQVMVIETVSVPLPSNPTLGPDPCDYVGASNQDTPNDPALGFEWIDPTSGTPISLGDDDATTVTLPFAFPFYGQYLTQITVCSNGFLETSTSHSFSNQPLPVNTIENFIGYWDDFDPTSGGQIYFYATSSYVVFAWVDVPHYGGQAGNTFEYILYPNGVIKMQFLHMDPAYTNSSTVGIQKGTGADSCFIQYVYNGTPPEHIITDSTVIMFWHQVFEHDVGVVNIEPHGTLVSQPYPVNVYLHNFGQHPEDFNVYIAIVDTVLGNTIISMHQPVSALQPDETREIYFFDWTPNQQSYYKLVAWIDLQDERSANDTLEVYARTALQLGDIVFGPVDLTDSLNDNLLLGVEFTGRYFYVTGSGSDGSGPPHFVYELDSTGHFTGRSWQQPDNTNDWGWRDMAYDGKWTGANGLIYASSSPMVDAWYIDDSGNLNVAYSFSGPENPNRALAYDPETDHFFTANFNNPIFEFGRDGTVYNTYPNTYSIYGAAYDPGTVTDSIPYIWFSTQETNQYGVANTIYQWSLATHSFTGVAIEPPPAANDATAGGLTFWPDFHGMSVLFELVQGDPYDYIVGYFVRYASETRMPYVATQETQTISYRFAIKRVSPNPAKGKATIEFTLPKKAPVTLSVYDITGRKVKTLVNKSLPAGIHSITWNGEAENGTKVSSGVYFFELKQAGKRAVRKFILVR